MVKERWRASGDTNSIESSMSILLFISFLSFDSFELLWKKARFLGSGPGV